MVPICSQRSIPLPPRQSLQTYFLWVFSDVDLSSVRAVVNLEGSRILFNASTTPY